MALRAITPSKRRVNLAHKGRRLEWRSRRWLEEMGYCVIRSARSGGPWDLVAVNDHEVLFVQVKANGWPERAELEAMAAWPTPPGTRRLIHRWDDYARSPQVRSV
jgi:Holliday junction resolvase-like predicted endonuclease